MNNDFDTLVLGSGAAGLTYALRRAEVGTVAIVTKRARDETNTSHAQGGIAAVMDAADSFEAHIEDTITAGDGLNARDIVRITVEEGPARLRELVALGVAFTRESEDAAAPLDLTREGGHSARRVVHAKDMTGAAIQAALAAAIQAHPNIQVFEDHHAIDLITRHTLGDRSGDDRCVGAYVLDHANNQVRAFVAPVVMLATGGAGKVYLYTSNPDIATGDGIAMAWRAGAQITNMEFFQFHPTCLFHPKAKSFLITEACRGEGGILRGQDGEAFMARYHKLKDLAPRDIVARAIDREMKQTGNAHVYLDMTHLPEGEVAHRFPGVHGRLMSLGIDMRSEQVPVVPAAHYCCGGVQCDAWGQTNIPGLLVCGEVAHTGLHGANRLASNSLLEAVVFADRAARISPEIAAAAGVLPTPDIPPWYGDWTTKANENVLVAHAWDETRRSMWNYVGIVRSNLRLKRARRRLDVLQQEIQADYWNYSVSRDLLELRNLVQVASLVVDSAMMRRESRGLHYTLDYPDRDDSSFPRDTILQRGRRR